MNPDEQITVLVIASPVPSHPSTEMLDETLTTVRDRLPSAEILVYCDGVAPALLGKHPEREADYLRWCRRFARDCLHRWANTTPIFHDDHLHEQGLVREALGRIRTPYMVLVEQDCPLVGDFPFAAGVEAIASGTVNVIRMYHETVMQPEHEYLMVGPVEDCHGIPIRKTVQYSSRPHLASTAWYRNIMEATWWQEGDGMVEDRMWSVIHSAWVEHGWAGWEQYRIGLWHPDGNIQGSRHLDGRGSDPKVTFRDGTLG